MTLKDSLIKLSDLELTPPVEPSTINSHVTELQPSLSSMMKYPLPTSTASADSLRQFYRGGQLPQKRILIP